MKTSTAGEISTNTVLVTSMELGVGRNAFRSGILPLRVVVSLSNGVVLKHFMSCNVVISYHEVVSSHVLVVSHVF